MRASILIGLAWIGCRADVVPVVEEPEVPMDPPIEEPEVPEPPSITHAFGALTLPPHEDNTSRCVQWSVGNEKPLYVQAVKLANRGSFHHSN
jgi:hypothetical protein